jgi:hypothetical protein
MTFGDFQVILGTCYTIIKKTVFCPGNILILTYIKWVRACNRLNLGRTSSPLGILHSWIRLLPGITNNYERS